MLSTPGSNSDADEILLARWRGGDTRAGDTLARRYVDILRKFLHTRVRPEDIEDVIQQVWIGISTSVGNPAAAEIHASLRSYVFGIARHTLFRHLRSRYQTGDADPIDSSIAALTPSLSQTIGERLEVERMIQALQCLPVDVHILLELRYFNQMSMAELAAVYRVPVGTIKSRLANARRQLDLAMRRR